MALLNKSNLYLKIDKEKTYIDANGMHICYEFYNGIAEREIEKVRTSEIKSFMDKADMLIERHVSEINNEAGKSGLLNRTDIFDEQGFFKPQYMALRQLQEVLASLQEDVFYINMHCYQCRKKGETAGLKNYEDMKALGFQDEWFINPLPKNKNHGTFLANNAVYSFDTSDMYRELKKIIPETTDC